MARPRAWKACPRSDAIFCTRIASGFSSPPAGPTWRSYRRCRPNWRHGWTGSPDASATSRAAVSRKRYNAHRGGTMRTVATLSLALLLSSGLFAQRNFVNSQPVVTGGFGSVVFPGGTPATNPGIQRFSNTFVSPLGAPQLVVPGSRANHVPRQGRSNGTAVYGYPVYVGGSYAYPGYGYAGDVPGEVAPQQQAPNVTVIYPPQPAPVVISPYGSADPGMQAPRSRMYEMPAQPAEPQDDTVAAQPEAQRYLIAFKDHTIYSASNYWVDGETLHYFT